MKNYTWNETVGGLARLSAGTVAGEMMDGVKPRAMPASDRPQPRTNPARADCGVKRGTAPLYRDFPILQTLSNGPGFKMA